MSQKRKSTESTQYKKEKKTIKTTISQEAKELGTLFGLILINNAKTAYHDDSGCFYDICQPYVISHGAWMYIYQPSKQMKEMEELIYSIIIKRNDKKKITTKMLNDATVYIEEAKKLYLQSYNDIVKYTNNKWSDEIDESLDIFEQVAKIHQPLYLEDGTLKMKFELRGDSERSDDWWYPARLYDWCDKKIDSDCPFDKDGKFVGRIEPSFHTIDGLAYMTKPAILWEEEKE